MQIFKWAIKKLGGFTREEYEHLRSSSENFAFEYLAPKNADFVTYNETFSSPRQERDVVLLTSMSAVRNSVFLDGKKVLVAPWAKNVYIAGNSFSQ
jgi:hypothetical protein